MMRCNLMLSANAMKGEIYVRFLLAGGKNRENLTSSLISKPLESNQRQLLEGSKNKQNKFK